MPFFGGFSSVSSNIKEDLLTLLKRAIDQPTIKGGFTTCCEDAIVSVYQLLRRWALCGVYVGAFDIVDEVKVDSV